MKLRNKITGEINIIKVDEDYFTIYKDDGEFVCPVTLKELNNGWEDYYEEPETFWYMTAWGDVEEYSQDQFAIKQKQEIGNYFETREEAEKAVEKLKAWKRLKDKGFRITLNDYKGNAWLQANWGNLQGDYSDVLLLFGGENG